MHIGLIGGIGPAATDFYYRKLIEAAAAKGRKLDLTMVHTDTTTLRTNLAKDDQAAQCAIYARLTDRLLAAGAENVVVTSIAGHFCIDRFAQMSPLPIVDLTKIVTAWLGTQGLNRIGIIGTETVMRSGMYGKLAPVEIMAPEGDDLLAVHEAYVTLAESGRPSDALRSVFIKASEALLARGAEAIMLGGTDLNAALHADMDTLPFVDCADIHVQAVAEFI